MSVTVLPATRAGRALVRGDRLTTGAAVVLVLAAHVVGHLRSTQLPDDGGVHAPTPPLYAGYLPRVGPGTPYAIVLALLAVTYGPTLAARLRWRPLLAAGYLSAVGWTVALAMIDGWRLGIAGRLTVPSEYLVEVPRIGDVGAFLRTFTQHILAFRPGSFTTHVAAHPPLAVLLFTGLDRIGLGGGGPAGVLCILVGASAPVAVAVTLRVLGGPSGERVARSGLPFAVLAPAAIWVVVSADGLYAGVLAWAVCGLALGCRGSAVAAFGSGLLFGACLYFSYGLTLAVVFPVALVLLTRRVRPVLWAAGGVTVVVAAFTAAGFWWWDGYRLTRMLYAQPLQFGSADRAYGYWVWAAPAAFAVTLGPAALAGVRRALAGLARKVTVSGGRTALPRPRKTIFPEWAARLGRDDVADGTAGPRLLGVLAGAALLAVTAADLSGLSRGETERIWLPFAMWLLPAAGLLPARHARWWLAAQLLLALAINHLLDPPW